MKIPLQSTYPVKKLTERPHGLPEDFKIPETDEERHAFLDRALQIEKDSNTGDMPDFLYAASEWMLHSGYMKEFDDIFTCMDPQKIHLDIAQTLLIESGHGEVRNKGLFPNRTRFFFGFRKHLEETMPDQVDGILSGLDPGKVKTFGMILEEMAGVKAKYQTRIPNSPEEFLTELESLLPDDPENGDRSCMFDRLVEVIYALKHDQRIDYIDEILAAINPQTVNIAIGIGFITYCINISGRLQNFRAYHTAFRARVAATPGRNADKLFKGLELD